VFRQGYSEIVLERTALSLIVMLLAICTDEGEKPVPFA
jgi:hypothetical protein